MGRLGGGIRGWTRYDGLAVRRLSLTSETLNLYGCASCLAVRLYNDSEVFTVGKKLHGVDARCRM